MYNEHLIDQLNAAREKAKVSHDVIASLWGINYMTSYHYLTKKRVLKRSDYESRAVALVKLLDELVEAGVLPLTVPYRRAKNGNQGLQTECVLTAISDYLENKVEPSN